jgi:RNA polymerase sigma-70 factor (ECF subfamily)
VCAQSRARPRRDVPLDAGPDRPAIDPGRADAAFGDLELRDRLDKAIAQLPEHYAFLIAAHHLRGVQYEALAEALDIPIGTVKTHLHRAKRQLREILER